MPQEWHRTGLSIALLAAITLFVFWPVLSNDFIWLDDPAYITENSHVNSGLSLGNALWAFTAVHSENWHPLTWISHMLDAEIYGLNPGGHHRTNLLLHLANVVLLYLLLQRITKHAWRSALVAVLFAVHPLRVESVAWAAERKDLLSTFFVILTIWANARYVEKAGAKRYLPVFLLYACALMSKPMPVTLPLLLLLLDYWPFGRLQPERSSVWKLAAEKAPLFALAAASSVITIFAQRSGGAMATLVGYPMELRLANAAVSYVRYIGKMSWPASLALPYPYSASGIPAWQVAGAVLLLAAATIAAFRWSRKMPHLIVGWLWFVVSLIPVIGLLQVGGQSMADKYTYTTIIKLFLIIV